MERAAASVLLLALALGAGCEESGENALVAPPPVLPLPRPPGPPRIDTLYIGFVTDRVEVREGETVTVDIEMEAEYWPPLGSNSPLNRLREWRFQLEVIGAEEAAEDLRLSPVPWGSVGKVGAAGTRWLAIQALPDGVSEGAETVRLRLHPPVLEPVFVGGLERPRRIELRNAELEVEIHDVDTAGVCSDVRIAATQRRLAWAGYRRCPSWNVFEAAVTVESDRSAPLTLDRLSPYGRIDGWRVEFEGSRIRHHLVLQWSND